MKYFLYLSYKQVLYGKASNSKLNYIMVRISKYFCEPNKGMQLRSGKLINCIANTDFYKEHLYYIIMFKTNIKIKSFGKCIICNVVNNLYYFLIDHFIFIKNEPQLAWYYYSIKGKETQQKLLDLTLFNINYCNTCPENIAKIEKINTYFAQYTNEPHIIHKKLYFHLLHKLNINCSNLIFEYL